MSCQRLLRQSQPKLSNQSCSQLFYLLSKVNKFWPSQKGQEQSVCPLSRSGSSMLSCTIAEASKGSVVSTPVYLRVQTSHFCNFFKGIQKYLETLQAKSLTAKSIKPLLSIANKSDGTACFKM